MLDKHLIYPVRPIADKDNIIFWKNYRITVLKDRLFRIEENKEKVFRDEATLSVFYRDSEKQKFTYQEIGDRLEVKTDKCNLVLLDELDKSYILLENKKVMISNKENLLGTARTLDMYDGNEFKNEWNKEDKNNGKKLLVENGVCSLSGVSYFDDADNPTLGKDGEVKNEFGKGKDYYVFAYGHDYEEAIKTLYFICGNTPLIPRFALGNWWSRFHEYTDREYLNILNRFEDKEIPLTVATIDMDWHYSHEEDIEETFHVKEKGRTDKTKYGELSGWTGYSWNKKLFPDYKKFLKEIEKKNLKITLNLHPADGLRWFEDSYNQMAKALGKNPSEGEVIPFDCTDSKYLNNYFRIMHKPYEKDGVNFWWIDWQQGKTTSIPHLDPLWSLNHYHFLDNALNRKEPLILSRYCGIGSHRYPLGFSGDTFISWKTLAYLPEFTATSSNIGYTWWSHDIGGHQFGIKDGELFVRHLQFGVFSPINRLHCCADATTTKEPWTYGNGTGLILEKFMRLRHEMIPYLYTADYATYKNGIPLCEPLYYHLDTPKAYKYKNEYYFGSELLVSPIVAPMKKDGYARVKTLLPKGTWTDIFTGDCYEVKETEKEFTLLRQLDSIPVLAKQGAVIPFGKDKGNDVNNPHLMDIWAFEGTSSYTMYEDGKTMNKDGELFIHFDMKKENKENSVIQYLTITSEGDETLSPSDRIMKIRFKNIPEGKISIKEDNHSLDAELIADYVCVSFKFNPSKTYQISVEYKEKTEMEKLISRALRILTEIEGINIDKFNLYKSLQKAENKEEYMELIQNSNISETGKIRLLENE